MLIKLIYKAVEAVNALAVCNKGIAAVKGIAYLAFIRKRFARAGEDYLVIYTQLFR